MNKKLTSEVKKFITQICKNLPSYPILDKFGNIQKVTTFTKGSIILSKDPNAEFQKKPIEPNMCYLHYVPLYTNPYKILSKAYKKGGLSAFENKLREYMKGYKEYQKIKNTLKKETKKEDKKGVTTISKSSPKF